MTEQLTNEQLKELLSRMPRLVVTPFGGRIATSNEEVRQIRNTSNFSLGLMLGILIVGTILLVAALVQ